MPTGYTAGILDGKIKTFRDFATLCMRNFGATIHMRDEKFDAPYEKRVPLDYYSNHIEAAKEKIDQIIVMSDEELVAKEKARLIERKGTLINEIQKCSDNEVRLRELLYEAESWTPPTVEHCGMKSFMIKQINDTIVFDCDSTYFMEEVAKVDQELDDIEPSELRAKLFSEAFKNKVYYQNALKKEIDRCNKSNEWVEQLLNSLPK